MELTFRNSLMLQAFFSRFSAGSPCSKPEKNIQWNKKLTWRECFFSIPDFFFVDNNDKNLGHNFFYKYSRFGLKWRPFQFEKFL